MAVHFNSKSIISVAVTIAVSLFLTLGAHASAQEIDSSSAVRGSLGVPISDLGLSNHFGALAFILNAGFMLLFGVVALYLVSRTPRERRSAPGHGGFRSVQSSVDPSSFRR